ncbi:MAG: nitrate/TMAO reductase-like tetraheme cytochrome c subunit [Phenylobacterium sp.]|jgi:nitrate/TMAO reductase-like tetraheme cytochrome c subunit
MKLSQLSLLSLLSLIKGAVLSAVLLFGSNVLAQAADKAATDTKAATDKLGDEAHKSLYKENEFPSAQECGACHFNHYREWSVSRHAYAQISPTFLAYQATLVNLTNGSLGDFCQRCHSQVGMTNGEDILTSNDNRGDVAKEGITCIACHRVAKAYGKITGRFPLEPGDIKQPIYGPRVGDELERVLALQKGKKLNTHQEARHLDQMSQPGFCGRCHDVRLVNGFRLEDAFSEYKQTAAAKKGETCQDCHMGPIPGKPSQYPDMPAAVVRGKATRPARHTNHMFVGPDTSIVHPGIFPIDSETREYATQQEWLSFDYKAGWGTDEFEETEPDESQFPGIWADVDERYAAREIVERQLALRQESHERGTTLLKNGYGLGEIEIVETKPNLAFKVKVKNLTDAHSVPTGLIAERNVFLQVKVTDAKGKVIFRSGDLDPNGDVRDAHSKYVHNGDMPLDKQLFNLRSPFMVRNAHGGEREQILPANYSLDPLIFMRPTPAPSLLFGGLRDIRLQKRNIEASGFRWANYNVEQKLLTGKGPYKINIKLVTGQLPPHLIDVISKVGFEYGLTARDISDAMVAQYRVLWERDIESK